MNERTINLIGLEKFEQIQQLKICIIGVGGVGSSCLNSLARSGVLSFVLIDFDTVNSSNLNRQLVYFNNDIGESKVECAKKYVMNINNKIDVKTYKSRFSDCDKTAILACDIVVDAIDDLVDKVKIVGFCLENNIKYIGSLGMGNRVSPDQVIITKLNNTTNDPLARKFRYMLRKEGVDISKIDVAFSKEVPLNVVGVQSMIFAPGAAGLVIASYIIKKIII